MLPAFLGEASAPMGGVAWSLHCLGAGGTMYLQSAFGAQRDSEKV